MRCPARVVVRVAGDEREELGETHGRRPIKGEGGPPFCLEGTNPVLLKIQSCTRSSSIVQKKAF